MSPWMMTPSKKVSLLSCEYEIRESEEQWAILIITYEGVI